MDGSRGPDGRVPPNALEAERAVLGGVLLDNSALNTVIEICGAEDFYATAHQEIFRAMSELFTKGEPLDTVTVRSALATRHKLQAVGGDEYLLSLTNTIPTVANIEAHAKIVREKSVVRRLILACHEVAAEGYGDYGEVERYLDGAEKKVFDVAKERVRHPYESIRDVVMRTFKQVQDAANRKQHITGVPTGFDKLDRMTAGMHPGDLIIVAGRPGMGKTSFALNIAVNAAAETKGTVAIFSLEMPKEQLGLRMLCSEARVDAGRMRTGHLMREDWTQLANAAGMLAGLPMYIDDS